jgi:indolepyruvate ferredoxin oxidoreductase, beta subunit
MSTAIHNVLMVGVGGQGIVLASDILCQAALNAGYDAKKSEIHGMSQRGGSIFSFVRFGEKIHSPVISENGADILVSLEEMETLRWLKYTHPGTKLIVSNTHILPSETKEYPKGIMEYLQSAFKDFMRIDASAAMKELGNPKYLNVYILGLVSKNLPLSEEHWSSAIKESVPEKHFESNLTAFKAGRK